MRKFPKASHTTPMFDGVGSSLLFAILCCICPPLGILFVLFYSVFLEGRNFDAQKIFNVCFFLSVGFIIIASPIVTVISLFQFGLEYLISNFFVLVLITIVELIVGIVIGISFIKEYIHKKNSDKGK